MLIPPPTSTEQHNLVAHVVGSKNEVFGVVMDGSQLFSPFRALGYVSTGVPFALQTLGSEHFVATVTGRSFHVYNVSRNSLLGAINVNLENPSKFERVVTRFTNFLHIL